MNWHPDPLINCQINKKIVSLFLLYKTRIEEWIQHPERPKLEELRNCMRVIEGKAKNVTLKKLNHIESFLKKHFSAPKEKTLGKPIDLTEDDDEEDVGTLAQTHQPIKEKEKPSDCDLRSMSCEATANSSSDSISQTEIVLSLTDTVRQMSPSILFENLPSHENSICDETSGKSQTAGSTEKSLNPKPRRKSVSSRPSQISANLPLISNYKIKHNKLKPPGVYAKPNDESANKPRTIITVPYKTVPKPSQVPYDPKKNSLKLEGIKEKIYAKNFLSFDAQKKEDLKKKFFEQQKITDDDRASESSDNQTRKEESKKKRSIKRSSNKIIPLEAEGFSDEEMVIETITSSKNNESKKSEISMKPNRRKSMNKQKPSTKTNFIKKVKSSKKIVSHLKIQLKNTARKSTSRLATQIAEEVYSVPSHVFENVEKDLAELFCGEESLTASTFETVDVMIESEETTSHQKELEELQSTSAFYPTTVKVENENEVITTIHPSSVTDINENEMDDENSLDGSMVLLREISESEACRPPKKRGRKKGSPKKRGRKNGSPKKRGRKKSLLQTKETRKDSYEEPIFKTEPENMLNF